MADDDAPSRARSSCYDKPVWTLRSLASALRAMPAHLARVMPTVANRPISGRLREIVMLAVSAENRCWYCQTAHTVFGRATGLSEREVSALLAGDDSPFTKDERLACSFARDLARRGFQSRDEQLLQTLRDRFSRPACDAIEAAAHVINFANRFGNTFDAARARLGRGGDCSGASGIDIAVVSSLFVPVALAITPWVGTMMLAQKLGLASRSSR